MADPPDWQLPPDAWTRADNIRFKENSAWKTYGYEKALHPPTVAPHFLMPVVDLNDKWWVYAGLEKIYGVEGGIHTNLTRQLVGVDVNYTGTAADRWNGAFSQGVPILNNGVDKPQMWLPVDSGQKMQDLSNWPANTTAKVIRGFKEYLIALNVTKNGDNYPSLVKWSHPADPLTVPISWDETDETKDAGEFMLGGNDEAVVDCLPIGAVNLIYKQEEVWSQSFIGGIAIFRFDRVFGDFGLLAQRCALDLDKQHFVVSTNDVLLHNGQAAQSLVEARLRRYLFNDIDSQNFGNSFALRVGNKEVWFCYPESGETYPTKALAWDKNSGALSFRDLPKVREGMIGFTPDGGTDDTWDADEQAWDLDLSPWGEAFQAAINKTILLPEPTDSRILRLDRTYQDDGANITAVLERTGMTFEAGDATTELNNPMTVKQITRLYPRFKGAVDQPIDIELGYSNAPDDPVHWGPKKQFVPGVDKACDYMMTGNLLSIRFSSTTDDFWQFTGYDLDIRLVGTF